MKEKRCLKWKIKRRQNKKKDRKEQRKEKENSALNKKKKENQPRCSEKDHDDLELLQECSTG